MKLLLDFFDVEEIDRTGWVHWNGDTYYLLEKTDEEILNLVYSECCFDIGYYKATQKNFPEYIKYMYHIYESHIKALKKPH